MLVYPSLWGTWNSSKQKTEFAVVIPNAIKLNPKNQMAQTMD